MGFSKLARSRRGLLILDQFVAGALIVGTVWDGVAGSLSAGQIAVLAIGASTVALRRITPAIACGLTIAALAASQSISTNQTYAQAIALGLGFYILGRHCDTVPRSAMAGGLLAAPVVVLITGPQGNSAFDVAASWSFACALPFAAGRAVAHHDAVNRSLHTWTDDIALQQKERAAEAADLERARVARELHDVIAHNVSVMVIQAVAARRTAPSDPHKATEALNALAACGHEALREMRQLVGVLRRDDLNSVETSSLATQDLIRLVQRAELAGLAVKVHVEGQVHSLPADLDLTIRRVIQEALTNAIRHAAPARVTITVTYASDSVELEVCDTGRHLAAYGSISLPQGGKGLVGMRERVELHRGQLTAGPMAGGGFRVHARLPLRADTSAVRQPKTLALQAPIRSRSRWFDAFLATLLFAACEVQLLASWHHRGSLLVETTILIGLTAPMAMRRQAPLAATATTIGFLILAAATPLNAISPDAMLFVLFIPPYSVAAYARKGRALAGLAICIAGWLALALTTTVGPPGWTVVSTVFIVVAWSLGRAIRARRRRAERLNRTAAAISSETHDLTRLAIADERTRIARRMQAAVARSVADMTVQTRAARILLDRDLTAADAAMAEIDCTGRRALNEMRALLGVLRAENDEAELAPQPSIGRLPDLIELTRRAGGDVAFRVQGEPRPIPGVSELTVYRIAEEALGTLAAPLLRQHTNATFAITFGDTQVALEVQSATQPASLWPTALMVERAHLSGGSIECFSDDGGSVSLRLDVPAEFEEVLL